MGDKAGGARDRDKADKRVEQVTAGAPPGREAEITKNVYTNIEKNARESERNLVDAIKASAVKGKDVSYYKDQESKMIDAIRNNPNLTNYQKVTQVNNIKAASDPMAVRSGYSLGERLAGAGTLGARTMRENTPLTQADIAMMPPEMQEEAKRIASRYRRPPVLRDNRIVAMGPNMSQLFGDMSRAGGEITSGIMQNLPNMGFTGMAINLFNKMRGTEPKPQVEEAPVNYEDYLGRERMLDQEYNFSPLTGIETLSSAPMIYDIPGMTFAQDDEISPTISIQPSTSEEDPTVTSTLGGYTTAGAPIIYPSGTGSSLVSYEDILNQIA